MTSEPHSGLSYGAKLLIQDLREVPRERRRPCGRGTSAGRPCRGRTPAVRRSRGSRPARRRPGSPGRGRRRRSRRCRRAWSRRPAGSCRCRGAQRQLQVGAVERRPPVLGDVVVVGALAELGEHLEPGGARAVRRPGRRRVVRRPGPQLLVGVGAGAGEVGAVRAVVGPGPEDRDVGGAGARPGAAARVRRCPPARWPGGRPRACRRRRCRCGGGPAAARLTAGSPSRPSRGCRTAAPPARSPARGRCSSSRRRACRRGAGRCR